VCTSTLISEVDAIIDELRATTDHLVQPCAWRSRQAAHQSLITIVPGSIRALITAIKEAALLIGTHLFIHSFMEQLNNPVLVMQPWGIEFFYNHYGCYQC
jgi:hypothetical protein